MTSAGAQDYNRGGGRGAVPTAGSRRSIQVRAPGQGSLKLLFACGAKIICVCVQYTHTSLIASEASEKLSYPSIFHAFCATLGEFPGRGAWPDCPLESWIQQCIEIQSIY